MRQHPQSERIEQFAQRQEAENQANADVGLRRTTMKQEIISLLQSPTPYMENDDMSARNMQEIRRAQIYKWHTDNPGKPKVVVFDIGGVFFPDPDGGDIVRMEIIEDVLGKKPDKDLWFDVLDRMMDGSTTPEEGMQELADSVGVDLPENAVERIMQDLSKFRRVFDEEVVDVLIALREQGVCTMALSNICEPEKNVLVGPIRQLFDHARYSYKDQSLKPDPKMLLKVPEDYNDIVAAEIKKDEVVFVDDNYSGMATDVGMQGIPYTTGKPEELVAKLKEMGLLPEDWKSFSKQRRNYIAAFTRRHKSMLAPHFKVGETLGRKEKKDAEGKTEEEKRIWRNVSEHCVMSALLAETIAKELGLDDDDVRKVTEAALIHDFDKKNEIRIASELDVSDDDIPGLINDLGGDNESLTEEGKEKAREMKRLIDKAGEEGDQKLRKMMDANDRRLVEDELIELSGVSVASDTNGPQTDIEKILYYVDEILTGAEVVSPSDRIAVSYENMRNKLWSLGYMEEFDGESLQEVETRLTQKFGEEFARRIEGFQGDVDSGLPFHFQRLLEKKIMAYEINIAS